MKTETKKIIAGILATGGLVSGSFIMSDKANCDHTIIYQGDEICITSEQKEALKSQLREETGFGFSGFGG